MKVSIKLLTTTALLAGVFLGALPSDTKAVLEVSEFSETRACIKIKGTGDGAYYQGSKDAEIINVFSNMDGSGDLKVTWVRARMHELEDMSILRQYDIRNPSGRTIIEALKRTGIPMKGPLSAEEFRAMGPIAFREHRAPVEIPSHDPSCPDRTLPNLEAFLEAKMFERLAPTAEEIAMHAEWARDTAIYMRELEARRTAELPTAREAVTGGCILL